MSTHAVLLAGLRKDASISWTVRWCFTLLSIFVSHFKVWPWISSRKSWDTVCVVPTVISRSLKKLVVVQIQQEQIGSTRLESSGFVWFRSVGLKPSCHFHSGCKFSTWKKLDQTFVWDFMFYFQIFSCCCFQHLHKVILCVYEDGFVPSFGGCFIPWV